MNKIDHIEHNEKHIDQSHFSKTKVILCRFLIIIIIVLILVFGYVTFTRSNDNHVDYLYRPDISNDISTSRELLNVSKAAVSCEHEICAYIGAKIMASGGSAVDSAIATSLCIGVTNPQSSGIGGGGFLLVRLSNGTSSFLDFREEAPAGATEDMFGSNSRASRVGGLSVAIPGEIKGFYAAWKRFGKLSWRELFVPAIRLALNGVPISKKLGKALEEHQDFVLNNSAWRTVFGKRGANRVLRTGEIYRNQKLANTLASIAINGPEAFYSGQIAKSIVKTVRQTGGILSVNDMLLYKEKWRDAVSTTFGDHVVLSSPPPASGSILLLMLNLIEKLQFSSDQMHADDYHLLVEVMKFGYAYHKSLGDPDFNSTVSRSVSEIISKELAAALAPKISLNKTHDSAYYSPKGHNALKTSTMHVSVIDSEGNAASLTSTINLLFGSKVLCPETGIILNNQMDDFSSPLFDNFFGYPPSQFNLIKPGKRPLSSTVPTIVFSKTTGQLELVVGASGGSIITSSVLLTMFRILQLNMDPFSAISGTRFHNQLYPPVTLVEPTMPVEIAKDAFIRRGHNISLFPTADGESFSGVSAVQSVGGRILGASDYRKWGGASGF